MNGDFGHVRVRITTDNFLLTRGPSHKRGCWLVDLVLAKNQAAGGREQERGVVVPVGPCWHAGGAAW